jgi:hypothetical protein
MVGQLTLTGTASGLAGPAGLAKLKVALAGRLAHFAGAQQPGMSFGSLLHGDGAAAAGPSAAAPARHKRGFDEPAPGKHHEPAETPLDSVARHAAQLAPPMAHEPVAPQVLLPPAAAAAAPEVRAHASLEDLLPALVRKVAWTGDGRRGTVRLELGAGALSGATLLVHTDEGRVRVHLDAPSGADVEQWRARITQRLAARGLAVDSVEVE